MKRELPPDGALLHSLANANHRWSTVLGEWIDNAFDAGARSIAIEFGKEFVSVKDDGKGCDDPTRMIQLGRHAKHATTRLGRYGIGAKEAMLWAGGVDSRVRITTVHGGLKRCLLMSWADYGRDWQVDEPSSEAAAAGDGGTSILITGPSIKKMRHGQEWQDLLDYLGYLYSPALKKGRQIKFKRHLRSGGDWEPLVRWEMPRVTDVIDTNIEVNGRKARVYCGIVPEGVVNKRAGFSYLHEWRVIEAASARGCGQYSPNHICGFVELDHTWPLTKNKDGISRDSDLLYAEVERTCADLLKRADSIGMQVASQAFDMAVNLSVNNAIAAMAKAKRGKGRGKGTKVPTGTGSPHQQAAVEQPGQRFPSRRGVGPYRVTYIDLDAHHLGQVKDGNILLNQRNPAIASLRAENNIHAILIAALALLSADHCYAPDGQMRFAEIPKGTSTEDFSIAVGTILATGVIVDGKPELKIAS